MVEDENKIKLHALKLRSSAMNTISAARSNYKDFEIQLVAPRFSRKFVLRLLEFIGTPVKASKTF